MAKANLTAQRLRDLLSYDPLSGLFKWLQRTSNRIKVGDDAGSIMQIGYVVIVIDGHHHTAHRLAWLHINGEWPKHQIDHIDGCRTNNRINNLRDVPARINRQNQRRARSDNKSSRHLGVTKDKSKWIAQIHLNGKHIHLGSFDTEEQAASSYISAKRSIHEGCAI